jgi:hypothetical protein
MPISTPPESFSNYNNDVKHFKHVMKWLFIPAVEKAGFESILPVARGSDIIHDHVISKLHSSDIVLCDMSNQNPKYKISLCAYTKYRDKLTIQLPVDIETPEDAKEEIKGIESKYGVKIEFYCPIKNQVNLSK